MLKWLKFVFGGIIMKRILFIGAGNMASAIANGLSKAGIVDDSNVILFDKNTEQYSKFPSTFTIATDIESGIKQADYIFLSVKPQNIKDVLSQIKIDIEACIKELYNEKTFARALCNMAKFKFGYKDKNFTVIFDN